MMAMPQTRPSLVFNVCMATTAAMALASCSQAGPISPDEANGCPPCFDTKSTARVTSGALTLTLPTGDTETYLPGAECQSRFATTTVPSAEFDAAPFLVCSGGSRPFSITTHILKDLSPLMPGEGKVPGDVAAATISVTSSAPCPVWVAQSMTIHVTDAVGQVVSKAGAVSDDYWRRMTVQLAAVPLGDAGCAGTSIAVDVGIEQAASDAVTKQIQCICL